MRRLLPLALVCVAVAPARGDGADADADADYESTTTGEGPPPSPPQASSTVTREQMDERGVRSTPDALRYEPGVYVQQTASGQASAYIRGRTGQQTVLLFDGIRLNNSLYRQGPNQYLHTVDPAGIDHLEDVRGGGSTRWGSDAIAGAVHAHPLRPGRRFGARAIVRAASADGELGMRVDASGRGGNSRVGWLLGMGLRRVGQLESGGPLVSPATGGPPDVARLEADNRTQMGTGFKELTSDARIEIAPSPGGGGSWTFAAHEYDQFDVPRTDQCPAPLAPSNDCLSIDLQARSLIYAAYQRRRSRFVASLQRHREKRTRRRPASFVENRGVDDVRTFGLTAELTSRRSRRGPGMRVAWGGDVYHDRVASSAETVFTDLDVTIPSPRGQYLHGSHHTTGGAFAIGELGRGPRGRWSAQAGARLGVSAVHAPRDVESGAPAIDRAFFAPVGFASGRLRAARGLAFEATIDRSFRAPNLDDLTARQTIGPGFQFENPALEPESSWSFELGARLRRRRIRLEAWLFRSLLGDAVVRVARTSAECPPASAECRAAWTRFQLVNAPGTAVIDGGEAALELALPVHLGLRATIAYARGESDNPQPRPANPMLDHQARVPISRVPPLNGTLELGWRPARFTVALGVRWATLADRLAPSDLSDPRIPAGGTPGYVVLDVRARTRATRHLIIGLVIENTADTAYRIHGSSLNGPGRGALLTLELH